MSCPRIQSSGMGKAMKVILLSLVAATLMTGCATNTGDPAKDAQGKQTNASLREGGLTLLRVLDAMVAEPEILPMEEQARRFGVRNRKEISSDAP